MLETIISKAGLKITETLTYLNNKYYIADYISKDALISKYIVFFGDSKFFCENIISKENYKEFEERVLESTFYNLSGDTTWNLYFVFCLTRIEYEKLPKKEIVRFEKEEKFARKIVINIESFSDYIPVAKICHSEKELTIVDPILDWTKNLEEYNLDFCLDSFFKSNIETYIEGKKVRRNKVVKSDKIDKSLCNRKIKEIKTNRFREHCFDKNVTIKFGDVNLFYGSNGCGKTSFLEAIELCVTGDIRKSVSEIDSDLYKKDISSGCSIILDNDYQINIPNESEKKSREIALYKNREKRGNTLNDAFHQYNYYTYEDTFKFCYLNEQPNYKEEFSKIIFGEAAQTCEKNLKRYLEGFKDYTKYYQSLLDNLEKELIDLEMLNKELVPFSFAPILDVFKMINYNSNAPKENDEFSTIQQWLMNLNSTINELNYHLDYVINCVGAYECNSKGQINSFFSRLQQDKQQQQDMFEGISKVIKESTINIDAFKKQVSFFNNKKDNLLKEYSIKKQEYEKFNDYNDVFNNIATSNQILDYSKELDTLNKQKSILQIFKNRFAQLNKCNVVENVDDLKKRLETKLQKQKSIKQKIVVVRNQIETEKKRNEHLNNTISKIKSLGQIYSIQSKSNICPLCNHEFVDNQELITAITNELNIDESYYNQLLLDLEKSTSELNATNSIIFELQRKIELLNEYDTAINYLVNNRLIEPKQELTFDCKKDIIKQQICLLEEINSKINSFRNFLDNQPLKISTILAALEYLNKKLNTNDKYIIKSNVNLIRQTIYNDFSASTDSINDINFEIEKANLELEEALKGLEKAQIEARNLILILDKMNSKLYQLDIASQHLKKIEDLGVSIDDDMLFTQLSHIFRSLISIIDKTNNDINNNILHVKNTKLIAEKQNMQINIKKKLIKIADAINILESLYPLEYYSDNFIKENIEEINKLFLNLHAPREFDRLSLNSKGELIAYRNESETPVNLMSAGQRTAVVLSVFLRMYLGMNTSPNFILLDEPVSNIDDLNILSLLDFLRELAISKDTQIFFTTANQNVAKLFRRKFSFLREKYGEYRLVRYGNTLTEIKKCTYNEFLKLKEETIVCDSKEVS